MHNFHIWPEKKVIVQIVSDFNKVRINVVTQAYNRSRCKEIKSLLKIVHRDYIQLFIFTSVHIHLFCRTIANTTNF